MPRLLQVWSFDKAITNKDKEELLMHFGAVDVKHVTRRGQDFAVLASFRSEEDCEYALGKLHQLEVMGVRLMAVYKDSLLPPFSEQPHRAKKETEAKKPSQKEKIKRKIQEFESKLNAVGSPLGFNHPIPPHLRYLYPPPSPSVIANIAQTLVAVPKFYTQVLHLMNKMNLPTPFGPVTKLPAVYAKVLNLMGYIKEGNRKERVTEEVDKTVTEVTAEESKPDEEENENIPHQDTSESESELESDGEEVAHKRTMPQPMRRKLKPKNTINKRPKFSLLKSTCVSHPRISEPSSVSEVFEASDSQGVKRLQLKLEGTVLPQAEAETVQTDSQLCPGEGFGKIESAVESSKKTDDNDMVEWQREASKYITKEELQNNVVNKEDWPILPVFKNYNRGEPSTKLYIKNLAKTTTEEDLKYVFGRYIFWQNDEEANMFTIRLLKEGRMKGQAFVTFPTERQALEALEDTNGYILKDKPMVVAFGKVKSS